MPKKRTAPKKKHAPPKTKKTRSETGVRIGFPIKKSTMEDLLRVLRALAELDPEFADQADKILAAELTKNLKRHGKPRFKERDAAIMKLKADGVKEVLIARKMKMTLAAVEQVVYRTRKAKKST